MECGEFHLKQLTTLGQNVHKVQVIFFNISKISVSYTFVWEKHHHVTKLLQKVQLG